MVGTSGRSDQRCSAQIASPRNAPDLICGCDGASEPEHICTVPASSASMASPPPLNTTDSSFGRFSRLFSTSNCSCGVVPIGDVDALNFSGLARASAMNSFMVFAGRSDFTTKMFGEPPNSQTGDEILERIVGDRVVKAVIDRIGVGREQDRVAVRFGARGIFHADIAAGAAVVLDDEGLAGRLLEPGGDQATDDVGRTARRIGDHDLHGAVRISGIGRAHAQQCRRGDAGGKRAGGFDNPAARRARCLGEFCHGIS